MPSDQVFQKESDVTSDDLKYCDVLPKDGSVSLQPDARNVHFDVRWQLVPGGRIVESDVTTVTMSEDQLLELT